MSNERPIEPRPASDATPRTSGHDFLDLEGELARRRQQRAGSGDPAAPGEAGEGQGSWLLDGQEPAPPPDLVEAPEPLPVEPLPQPSADPGPAGVVAQDPSWLLEMDESSDDPRPTRAEMHADAEAAAPLTLEASFCEPESTTQTVSRAARTGVLVMAAAALVVAGIQLTRQGASFEEPAPVRESVQLEQSLHRTTELEAPVTNARIAVERSDRERQSTFRANLRVAEPEELTIWPDAAASRDVKDETAEPFELDDPARTRGTEIAHEEPEPVRAEVDLDEPVMEESPEPEAIATADPEATEPALEPASSSEAEPGVAALPIILREPSPVALVDMATAPDLPPAAWASGPLLTNGWQFLHPALAPNPEERALALAELEVPAPAPEPVAEAPSAESFVAELEPPVEEDDEGLELFVWYADEGALATMEPVEESIDEAATLGTVEPFAPEDDLAVVTEPVEVEVEELAVDVHGEQVASVATDEEPAPETEPVAAPTEQTPGERHTGDLDENASWWLGARGLERSAAPDVAGAEAAEEIEPVAVEERGPVEAPVEVAILEPVDHEPVAVESEETPFEAPTLVEPAPEGQALTEGPALPGDEEAVAVAVDPVAPVDPEPEWAVEVLEPEDWTDPEPVAVETGEVPVEDPELESAALDPEPGIEPLADVSADAEPKPLPEPELSPEARAEPDSEPVAWPDESEPSLEAVEPLVEEVADEVAEAAPAPETTATPERAAAEPEWSPFDEEIVLPFVYENPVAEAAPPADEAASVESPDAETPDPELCEEETHVATADDAGTFEEVEPVHEPDGTPDLVVDAEPVTDEPVTDLVVLEVVDDPGHGSRPDPLEELDDEPTGAVVLAEPESGDPWVEPVFEPTTLEPVADPVTADEPALPDAGETPLEPVAGEAPFEPTTGAADEEVTQPTLAETGAGPEPDPDADPGAQPAPTVVEPSVALTDLEDIDAIVGPELEAGAVPELAPDAELDPVAVEDPRPEVEDETPRASSRLLASRRSMLELYGEFLATGEVPSDSHAPLPQGVETLGPARDRDSQIVTRPPRVSATDELDEQPAGPAARPGALRRASEDGRWDSGTVPMEALTAEERLLTPQVGDVRVTFVDGGTMDGGLHAVGTGKVWLDLEVGRMTFDAKRVASIERIPSAEGPDPGDTASSLHPRVTVRTKGGVFVGNLISQEGDRVTLRTEEGLKLTLVSEDVELDTGRRKNINIRRRGDVEEGSAEDPAEDPATDAE